MNDKVVVRVAVKNAAALVVAAVGVQVAATPRAPEPFLNCTVPVGPAPLLFVVTFAVRVTLPPDITLDTLGVTVVVVAAFVTVTGSATGPLAL